MVFVGRVLTRRICFDSTTSSSYNPTYERTLRCKRQGINPEEMQTSFIDTLFDPAVRDLAWVIGSPGLIDAAHPAFQNRVVDDIWCNAKLEACSPWLAALDLSPRALHDFIASRPTRRLGHYFETLISFWLMHMPDTQLIACNLQVQDEQRTLGEYDFLFRDAYGAVFHWEAAIKFYLQVQPLAEQSSCIGPGTVDRLDLKLDRVFQHQLMLGNSIAGQQALPSGTTLNKTQAFIKGYLFYHAAEFIKAAIQGVSASHLSGWWIRHALEELPQTSSDTRWIVLPRMRWPSPARLPADAEVMTLETVSTLLDTHFITHTDPLLLFEMRRTKSGWMECSRGFVVCTTWPIITDNV